MRVVEIEQRLPGGNVGGAVRVGDTVRRPTGPWTPAVHALLAHLQGRIPCVPKVLGFDGQGREVLSYLPGRSLDPALEWLTAGQLRSLVRWTRQLHAAVADFDHPGPWRMFPVRAPSLVGHNDIASYNACFEGEELTGVFDWDLAGPSTPLLELAFVAWNGVPLHRDDLGPAEMAERLTLIADSYAGGPDPRAILHAVPVRIELMIAGIRASAAAGDPGMANLVAGGEQERDRASVDALKRRIPAIDSELGR